MLDVDDGLETPSVVLRELHVQEATRARSFGVSLGLISAMAVGFTPFLGRDRWLTAAMLATTTTIGLTSFWAARMARDESRYTTGVRRMFALTCGFGCLPVTYFLGVFSPVPVVVTLGISFFALGSDRICAFGAPLIALVGYVLMSFALLLGLAPDHGVFGSDDTSFIGQLFMAVLVPVVFGATIWQARTSRGATFEALERSHQAAQIVRQREAQIVAANQSLDEALRARQQQRLEAIGSLAAGVAHEINNPLQGILNYAELIDERAEDPDLVREFTAEITSESQRVATIVRNLLVFARQDRDPTCEPVDVHALVDATLSLIQAGLRKDHVDVRVDLPADLPVLNCRRQPIQQVLMNLISNARDALVERYPGYDERKRISIRAQTFTPTTGDGSEPWLRISVVDQAGGISEPTLARIFDPFFTTKSRALVAGLGLSVSHGIAREHGGELRVESELGVGSRFMLELPLAQP